MEYCTTMGSEKTTIVTTCLDLRHNVERTQKKICNRIPPVESWNVGNTGLWWQKTEQWLLIVVGKAPSEVPSGVNTVAWSAGGSRGGVILVKLHQVVHLWFVSFSEWLLTSVTELVKRAWWITTPGLRHPLSLFPMELERGIYTEVLPGCSNTMMEKEVVTWKHCCWLFFSK